MILDRIRDLCLSYFLCSFNPSSASRLTRDVVREVASASYATERVDEFLEQRLSGFQTLLVDEFNDRYAKKRPLRYQIADAAAVGRVVSGYRAKRTALQIAFQNAMNRLSAGEFEVLSAVVLRSLGCQAVFRTPQSHDQGVDAFGQVQLVEPTPYGLTHQLTWIAQAKHYTSASVGSADIRELVGSRELMITRVFSTVDERYKELRLRPFGPTAVALVTSEEIPLTVRRLADGAGVFVFASSDLYFLLRPSRKHRTVAGLRAMITHRAKRIPVLD
jgi:hypothetical protein